jgi:hypothetical protein
MNKKTYIHDELGTQMLKNNSTSKSGISIKRGILYNKDIASVSRFRNCKENK